MARVAIEIYPEKFFLFPHLFVWRAENADQAVYFGHRAGVELSWLWWTMLIVLP